MRRARVIVLLMPAFLCGCVAAWHRVDLNAPQPLSPTQQIEIWRGDSSIRWHVVDVTKDSIIGTPLGLPVAYDSCHRAIARAQVDSVRWGDSAAGFFKTAGLTLLTASSVVFAIAVFQAFGRD